MVSGLLPKEMHVKDEPLTIREVRHVIVGPLKPATKKPTMTKSLPLKTNQIETPDRMPCKAM
jgi:hypothetical protein